MIGRWIERLSLALARAFLPDGYEIRRRDSGADFVAKFMMMSRSR